MPGIFKREDGSDLQILYVLLGKGKNFALIFKLAYSGITENLGFAKLKGKHHVCSLDLSAHCKKLYLPLFYYIILCPSLLGLDESSADVL